jgi:hypothetical protein
MFLPLFCSNLAPPSPTKTKEKGINVHGEVPLWALHPSSWQYHPNSGLYQHDDEGRGVNQQDSSVCLEKEADKVAGLNMEYTSSR